MLYEILSTLEFFAETLLRKVSLFFDRKIDKTPMQKGFQVRFLALLNQGMEVDY